VEFERAYARAQKQGHEQLLKIQEDYLRSGDVQDAANVAKLARGQIKQHLTLLDDAGVQLKG
jgi:putative membrane protein